MKKLHGVAENGKFDLVLSKITNEEILSVDEMICIRGGDGDSNPNPPPKPPEG